MIIGNKDVFAVEIRNEKSNSNIGFAKIWIENNFLGTIEDLIFLKGYLISVLDQFVNSTNYDLDFRSFNNKQIFNHFQSLRNSREFLISGSTFIDDFEIYSWQSNENICIIWQLRNVNQIFEELKGYSSKCFYYKVQKNLIVNVRNESLKQIMASS